MADYYTQASFTIPLNEAQAKYAIEIYTTLEEDDEKQTTTLHDEILEDGGPINFGLKHDKECSEIWIYSLYDNINTNHVCAFIQHLINKFDLPPCGFEVAYTCSKPRLDAFGGAAFWITKNDIEVYSTNLWLTEKQATLC